MTKHPPTFSLEAIKKLLADPSTRIVRKRDRAEAASLGYADDNEMVARVNLLRHEEFDKTDESDKKPGLWFDVYKTSEGNGTALYIKLQLDYDGKGVIVSFKRK